MNRGGAVHGSQAGPAKAPDPAMMAYAATNGLGLRVRASICRAFSPLCFRWDRSPGRPTPTSKSARWGPRLPWAFICRAFGPQATAKARATAEATPKATAKATAATTATTTATATATTTAKTTATAKTRATARAATACRKGAECHTEANSPSPQHSREVETRLNPFSCRWVSRRGRAVACSLGKTPMGAEESHDAYRKIALAATG